MITVCAIYEFRDKAEGVYRKVGDRFEVSKERYFEILEKGGDWVVPVAEISKEDLQGDESNKASDVTDLEDSSNSDSENSSDNVESEEDKKPEKRKKFSKRKSEDKGE